MRPVEAAPNYTNELIRATSPHLRQHADSPVFWQLWGEDAFARARAENKPIILSIGYFASYECHAMRREVFEHPSIAAMMNEHFVCIKVDAEELPEVDATYMLARQVMTEQGGWPNHVFLTPELKPFYAGGAYTLHDRVDQPSWQRLLEHISMLWTTDERGLRQNADEFTEILEGYLIARPQVPGELKDAPALTQALFEMLSGYFDERAGGFFRAPKFPHETYLLYLLQYYTSTRDERALYVATQSLFAIATGGMHDHVGGGFHRYAIDREWMVPRFEKMLYSQALLARSYTELFRVTGNPYAEILARSTLDFARAAFASVSGTFFTAIDAEINATEGEYYVWDAKEIKALLTQQEAEFFAQFFQLADIPVMPGHNKPNGAVLLLRENLWQAAIDRKRPYQELSGLCGQVLNKLLEARNKRSAPRIDSKIITSWNGLMIEALARASAVFNQPDYYDAAARAANFLLASARDESGMLLRLVPKSDVKLAAALEDYAYFIQALLMLYRVKRETHWMEQVRILLGQTDALFGDPEGGYFFNSRTETTLLRTKLAEDSILPSANGVMLHNFIDLYELTGEEAWKKEANTLADAFLPTIRREALPEYSHFLHACLRMQHPATMEFALTDSPPVTVRAELLPEENGIQILAVHVDIAEGWHVYAPDILPPLVATQVSVSGAETLGVSYPMPEAVESPASLEKTRGYKRPFTIRLNIKRPENVTEGSVLVTLRAQPCRGSISAAIVNEMLSI